MAWEAGAASLLILGIIAGLYWMVTPSVPGEAVILDLAMPAGVEMSDYPSGAFSKDGRQFVFVGGDKNGTALWLRSLGSPASRKLEGTEGAEQPQLPIWSPDGRYLLFAADNKIKKIELASGTIDPLWTDPSGLARPEGRFIIYGESGVNLQVGSVDDETRKATTIANSGSPDQARFSPDGRWIAFNAVESGTVAGTEQCQVFVSAYPPRGAPQRITDHGGVQPIWREDGRELYYLDPAGNLMAIPVVQTEPNFGVGAPRLLFKTGLKKVSWEVEDYAVADNGKRFLVKLPTEGETQAGFTIVLNWPALLAGAK